MEFKSYFWQDDMYFVPYMDMPNEWQCKMQTKKGVISVRFGALVAAYQNSVMCYEVWYPTDSVPTPNQTADDIWNYIRMNK